MRVLVVEDEHKIAHSIKQGLEQEKYAVDISYDGLEGYDFATSEEYDALILDWMLPGMNGVEITRKLRDGNVHTPVIILTAKGQVEDKIKGLDTGADDYITKPFAFTELLARIRAITRRPKQANGIVLKVANLSLDTRTYEVQRGGRTITLSSKEYALLEYLMRHKNQVMTKEQIIHHVWNYDADVLPNSVEVYIKHLRDKIDKPFENQPLIHTVRGFGYKISK